MALNKVTYVDNETVIYAQNLNDIQDAIIALEQGGGGIPAPSNPSNGQFLVYSSAQSAWIAQTVPSANGVSF